MKGGLIRMMAAMSLGAMPISLRGAWWPDSVRDFEQLTPDNCGSASNGGRKNSVAKAKREAKKARNRNAQRRYR